MRYKKIEHSEIIYQYLNDIISTDNFSDNIGSYYQNLLQEREYRYEKDKDYTDHCLFLNSLLFACVKYPFSISDDHGQVSRYLLRRLPFYSEANSIKRLPKNVHLYIMNNQYSQHYNCFKFFWCTREKLWKLESYNSMRNVKNDKSETCNRPVNSKICVSHSESRVGSADRQRLNCFKVIQQGCVNMYMNNDALCFANNGQG